MSSTPEDVKVRLSPEGIDDIVKALRAIEKEADKAGKNSAASFKRLTTAGIDLKRTLTTLGIVGAVTGLISFVKTTNRLADEAGKTASRLGTTAESISVLRAEAKLANVENQQLEQGLTNLTDSIGELIKGTKGQTDAFKRLGLSEKDFDGKDTAQAFDLIAQKVSKFGDSASKTRAIIDIFGKRVGPQLIPLLNQLGEKGFGEAAKQAERFGLVIDSKTAAAADAVGDSFDLLGAQVRGLATQFLSGLAPVVATVMEDFRNDVAGTGVSAAQDFGKSVGETLRNVIGFFQVAGAKIGQVVAKITTAIRNGREIQKALNEGRFDDVVKLQQQALREQQAINEAFDEHLDQLAAERAASEKRAQDLVDEAKKREENRKKLQDELALLEKQQAAAERKKKADEEFAKLEKDLAEIEEKHLEKVKTANEEREKIEQSILEATGQTKAAKIAALDEELAKQRMIFAEAGLLTDQQLARLAKLRDVKVAQIDFEEIKDKGERALDDLARARERIQQDVQLGISTEFEGQQRIAQLEQARLPILQQLSAAATAAAQATGSPEAIAAAEQFAAQIRQVEISVNNVVNTFQRFKNAGAEAFQGAFKDLLLNLKDINSVEDAFRSLAATVLQSLAEIAADILAKQATFALLKAFGLGGIGFSGGGAVKAATGGYITGPGTSTSDSIPAWLSDGEFVVRAAAVQQPGILDMLHALNRTARVPRNMPRRYAEGGLVSPVIPGKEGGTVGLEIGLESGLFARLIAKPENVRATIRELGKNKRALNTATR